MPVLRRTDPLLISTTLTIRPAVLAEFNDRNWSMLDPEYRTTVVEVTVGHTAGPDTIRPFTNKLASSSHAYEIVTGVSAVTATAA